MKDELATILVSSPCFGDIVSALAHRDRLIARLESGFDVGDGTPVARI
ncbi:MAG: hypothetical protein Q7S40_09075 [Opitutaceae bacterium]|nr:hypothetical protein [Opitutaceae bacterium]